MKYYYWFVLFFSAPFIYGQNSPSQGVENNINEIFQLTFSDSAKAKKLTNLVAHNRYDKSSVKYIKEAEKLAFATGKILPKVDIYIAWGNYYFYNSDFQQSETYFQKALKLLKQQPNPLIKATIEYSLGGIYRKKGNISRAIEIYLDSKKELDNVDTLLLTDYDKKMLFTRQIVLGNSLANFYNQLDEYDKAIEYYDFAFEKAINLKPVAPAGIILSNKGSVLIEKGEYNKALETLKKAKDIKTKGNSSALSLTATDKEIAIALLNLKEYKKALQTINKVIELYEEKKYIEGLQDAYIVRGQIYTEQKQYDKAIADCEKGKKLSLQTHSVEYIEKATKCLSRAYKLSGDYKNALLNFEEHQQIKDSVYNEKNVKKITRLEMQYEFDKEQQRQQLINQAKERESKMMIQSLLLGLIALLIIAGLTFRINYVRRKKNNLLKEKNEQISKALATNETLLKEIHHRVKNNLQIISSLLNMQAKFLKDDKSKSAVADSQNRIKSMSLIHQQLYQGENLVSIETTEYFNKLIEGLAHSYGINHEQITTDIESAELDVDTAIPIGLILNELITNAFKYGVDKQNGSLYFNFKVVNDKYLEIHIKDNGPGLPAGFDITQTNSYGMKLVQILGKKLKANIDFNNENGLHISIKIYNFKLVK